MPQYKLRVLVGPAADRVVPVNPNDEAHPSFIDTEHFVGSVWVRVRDYQGLSATREGRQAPRSTPYFDRAPSITYSIMLRGRFRRSFSANDLVFGNVFDGPLRLPPGASLGVRMLRAIIDPGLEADLWAEQPWAWSPVVCTMNAIAAWPSEVEAGDEEDRQPDASQPLQEHAQRLYPDRVARSSAERKKYFADEAARSAVELQPELEYAMDFCNGMADFNTLGVKIPGWGSVSLVAYWDGQPLTYVMRTRDGSATILAVTFKLVEVDEHGQPLSDDDDDDHHHHHIDEVD
ncbi:hypothetical protein THASP1DRAFT_14906 [Thamnocephalis sphaerospora]|uniref:Domain of unknown function at the cortex 1 domain-containing protein n=1 Tax=Thamnocephalis sphaerospora TaxID=78915 RepID=A0A4P9XU47_9FUNG|nr:hypothetical protein THASP1DRAFT_14906 [Thamnocephalis sphaerospora]|eukprot:RKP08960.1 hypothetical protein THASP1DRAFT_14906 [Thamnocephalis sphaerospora]